MSEWLKPISRAARVGLAGTIVAVPLVACRPTESTQQSTPTPIIRPLSEVFPPYACTPLNTITSVDGKIPIFDIQRSQSNPLAEIGIPAIMDRLSRGKYMIDYHQINQQYPSVTTIHRNLSGVLDLMQEQINPEKALPQWVIEAAEEAQTPMVVTVLREQKDVRVEDGISIPVYQRTLIGYRLGAIPELPYPARGELSAREGTPGSIVRWGYDFEMIQKIVENEVNQLEKNTTAGAGLYPQAGYCIQETPS